MKKNELLKQLYIKMGKLNTIKALLKDFKENDELHFSDDDCIIYNMTGDVEMKLYDLENELKLTEEAYKKLNDEMEY